MFSLPLSQGKIAVVDGENEHFGKWKWSYSGVGYARRGFMFAGKQKTMYLHHAVIGHPIDGREVDHINGDRLDCRKSNLRLVTRRENTHNKLCHRSGTKKSKFIGVYRADSKSVRWASNLCLGRQRFYLGIFDTEEEARDAYQRKLEEINHAS